jgi:hypothetical protein
MPHGAAIFVRDTYDERGDGVGAHTLELDDRLPG